MDTPPKSRLQSLLPFLLGVLATLMVLWLVGSTQMVRALADFLSPHPDDVEVGEQPPAREGTARTGHVPDVDRRYQADGRARRSDLGSSILADAPAHDGGEPVDELALLLADGGHLTQVVEQAPVAPAATLSLFPLEPVAGGLQTLKVATIASSKSVQYNPSAYRTKLPAFDVAYDGAAGDEAEEIRKLKSGELHGALISTFGLAEVLPDALVFSVPGLVRNHDEWQAAMDAEGLDLTARLHQQGLEVLAWFDLGDAYFFSESPDPVPEALGEPVFAPSSLPGLLAAYAPKGGTPLTPYVGSSSTLAHDLGAGTVRSFVAPPWFVADSGLYRFAPYVVHVPWLRMTGALVYTHAALASIPEDAVSQLRTDAKRWSDYWAGVNTPRSAMHLTSIDTTQYDLLQYLAKGLHVTLLEPKGAEWDSLSTRAYNTARDGLVSRAAYTSAYVAVQSARTRAASKQAQR